MPDCATFSSNWLATCLAPVERPVTLGYTYRFPYWQGHDRRRLQGFGLTAVDSFRVTRSCKQLGTQMVGSDRDINLYSFVLISIALQQPARCSDVEENADTVCTINA